MRFSHLAAVAALLAAAAVFLPTAHAEDRIDDAEALALVQKHCVSCHAARPAQPSFRAPPKNVTLDTLPELKRHAKTALRTLLNRTMPLGNKTGMTEEERAKLAAWLRASE